MANSLRAKLRKLKFDRNITDVQCRELLKKLDHSHYKLGLFHGPAKQTLQVTHPVTDVFFSLDVTCFSHRQ